MSKIRVCLVDDEPNIIELMKMQLELDDRIEVVGTGGDGRDALRLANTLRPDVMVLDITMPNLNGQEAAARISSAFPPIAVLIASGNRDDESRRGAVRAGARDFLEKPVDAQTLINGIIAANKERDPKAPARGLATVWTFYGAKANAGCTTLAVGAAVDLASMGYRTCLVDLDTTSGDCASYLHQKLPKDGVDVFTQLFKLPAITADTLRPLIHRAELASRPPVRFDTLMTPGQFTPLGPRAPEVLRDVFDLLITQFDYVLVDLPPGRLFDRHIATVLDFAERLFLVSNSEISSLTAVRAITTALAESGFAFDRFSLVLSSLIAQPGLDPRQWLKANLVPLSEILEMPCEPRVCADAFASALPPLLAAPRSEYSTFVSKLVDHALNRPPSTGNTSTFWAKIQKRMHG